MDNSWIILLIIKKPKITEETSYIYIFPPLSVTKALLFSLSNYKQVNGESEWVTSAIVYCFIGS